MRKGKVGEKKVVSLKPEYGSIIAAPQLPRAPSSAIFTDLTVNLCGKNGCEICPTLSNKILLTCLHSQ